MLPIQQKFIKFNFTKGVNKPVYLVIHDTGNTAKGANALNHYTYFNGGDRQASAHYFVDESNIIQTVKHEDKSWHCGDGGAKATINNVNSIGIEICINSDGNYTKAVENTVELTKHLMKSLNISVEKVVRHFDASGKSCPNTMSANSWAKWKEFKIKLGGSTGGGTETNLYRVRKSWADAGSQKGAFAELANAIIECKKYAGYSVYDNKGIAVYSGVVTPYRVRKSWADAGSQKGAFTELANAITECKKYAGYSVYDNNGTKVYPNN